MTQLVPDRDDRLSEVFDQLSDPLRRRILARLLEENPREDPTFESVDLAEDGEVLELLESKLYHNHLPKLGDAGFVDVDGGTNAFRRGPRFDEIAPLLRLMADHEEAMPEDWP